jgi:colanic acid biosynthesis protein WcaH
MDISESIKKIESSIPDARRGLPEDVFLLISQLTPLVNVDLLIKNEKGQTLLTWREDGFFHPGWHVPGGIIRYKESFAERIQVVAANELGCGVKFGNEPLVFNECMIEEKKRGHFISFLYECILCGSPDAKLEYRGDALKNGQWFWHDRCPDDLMEVHEIYRKYI